MGALLHDDLGLRRDVLEGIPGLEVRTQWYTLRRHHDVRVYLHSAVRQLQQLVVKHNAVQYVVSVYNVIWQSTNLGHLWSNSATE